MTPYKWIAMENTDCLGGTISPPQPAQTIYACVEQCDGFYYFEMDFTNLSPESLSGKFSKRHSLSLILILYPI